jgi:acetyl esterase/lipase
MMKRIFASISVLLLAISVFSQADGFLKELNIHYYSNQVNLSDKYINEKCLLDLYYPGNMKGFPTIVWFHGGGLTGGDKALPPGLLQKGTAVVSVSYRLYPVVKCPEYIEDAAAAVAWVFNNIEKYGGDTRLIFVAGHSAGAYLTSMVGLDKKWLAAWNIDANRIAALFPLSGNGITHQAIRAEKGLSNLVPVVDEYAPLFHVRPDAPPMILMTGDRELEYIGRYEENAYMIRMMKLVGHKETILYEFDGYPHNMLIPAFPLLHKHLNLIVEKIRKNSN